MISDHFKFIFKGFIEWSVIYYTRITINRTDKSFINGQQTISRYS